MRTLQFAKHRAMLVIGLTLVLYAVTFTLTYPEAISVWDESRYIRQSSLFASGRATVVQEMTDGNMHREVASQYLTGTSVLMAPSVAIFGWRGAFIVPFACFIVTILVVARWLSDEGLSPLFALSLLIYPATVGASRLAMSDLPSMALVALALRQLWRASHGCSRAMIAAGIFAGLSLSFREPNALALAPFFVGSIIRRDSKWALALVGGVLGCCVRIGLSWIVFDDPLFYSKALSFSTSSLLSNLVFTLICTVLLLPGGLIWPANYQGQRAPELRIAVYGFVVFHICYSYIGLQSGPLKAIIVGGRYFLPICPLMIVAAADVTTRKWRRWSTLPAFQSGLFCLPVFTRAAIAIVGIAITVSLSIHWVLYQHSRMDAEVIRAIYSNTADHSVILTNTIATDKWLNGVYGDRIIGDLAELDHARVVDLLQRKRYFYLITLERFDSHWWRRENLESQAKVHSVLSKWRSVIVMDRLFGPNYHLQIAHVSGWLVEDPLPTY